MRESDEIGSGFDESDESGASGDCLALLQPGEPHREHDADESERDAIGARAVACGEQRAAAFVCERPPLLVVHPPAAA